MFDPSAFPKKGDKSVGVGKQWCGRLGKVENCQVGVYMAYVTRKEHAIVNTRLYLPEEWAKDRGRRKEAGVPKSIKFSTRHQLALEMLAECGGDLPHTWIAGDDEMGRPSGFRLELRALGERYLLAVPSNTLIRDIECAAARILGTRADIPRILSYEWTIGARSCPKMPGPTIDVRDGEKGPLVIEAVKRRVQARTETGGTGPDEVLFVTRERQADNTYKLDYYLSNADADVPLEEFRQSGQGGSSRRRVLRASQRRSRLGGLSGQELDSLASSPNPVAASRVVPQQGDATGKKNMTPALTFPQLRQLIAGLIDAYLKTNLIASLCRRSTRWLTRNEQARFYRYRSRNILPPLKNQLRN